MSNFQKQLVKYDHDEEKRRIARKNLQVYLMEHTKPDGLLTNCDVVTKKELLDTMSLHDGTKDQYVDLFYYWMRKVEKLKNRQWRQQDEDKRTSDSDCVSELFFVFKFL